MAQAEALLAAAGSTSLHAYIVVSLLTGARTEELRALTWSYVDLDSDPPFIMVWRSIRAGGETKTRKSRRTLKLPQRCVEVLRDHEIRQEEIRHAAASTWQDNDLVFPSRVGTPADASHVRAFFPQGRRSGGAGSSRVDSARAAAQLRLAAFRCRCSYRAHLPSGRPQQHDDDGDDLPQADPSGDRARR